MAKKSDANHVAFSRTLEEMGWLVGDMHELGKGYGDIFVRWPDDLDPLRMYMIEIKSSSDANLTKPEKKRQEEGWPIVIARHPSDFLKKAGKTPEMQSWSRLIYKRVLAEELEKTQKKSTGKSKGRRSLNQLVLSKQREIKDIKNTL